MRKPIIMFTVVSALGLSVASAAVPDQPDTSNITDIDARKWVDQQKADRLKIIKQKEAEISGIRKEIAALSREKLADVK